MGPFLELQSDFQLTFSVDMFIQKQLYHIDRTKWPNSLTDFSLRRTSKAEKPKGLDTVVYVKGQDQVY